MKLGNAVKSVRVLHDYVLRVVFSDGYVGQVDLGGLFADRGGPLIDELCKPEQFGTAAVAGGTVTFANGYDICPDVLRFYCERGGVVRQDETDAAFDAYLRQRGGRTVAVAEDKAPYGRATPGKKA